MAYKNIFVEQRILHSLANNALDGVLNAKQSRELFIKKIDDFLLSKTTHPHLDVESRSKMTADVFKKALSHTSSFLIEKDKNKESRMTELLIKQSNKNLSSFFNIAKKNLGLNINLTNSIKKAFSLTEQKSSETLDFSFPIRNIIKKEHEYYLKNKNSSIYLNSSRYKDFKSIMKNVDIDKEKINSLDITRVVSSLNKELKIQPWDEIANKSMKIDFENAIGEFEKKFDIEVYQYKTGLSKYMPSQPAPELKNPSNLKTHH